MNKNRVLVLILFMVLALQTGYAQEDIVIHCDEEDATYYEQCYYDSLLYMDEKMQNDPDEYYRTWTNYYESLTDEERAEQIKIGNQVLCYPDETDISRERARALGYAVLEQFWEVKKEELSYYYADAICLLKENGTHVWQVMLTRVGNHDLDLSTYYVHIDSQSEKIVDAIKL